MISVPLEHETKGPRYAHTGQGFPPVDLMARWSGHRDREQTLHIRRKQRLKQGDLDGAGAVPVDLGEGAPVNQDPTRWASCSGRRGKAERAGGRAKPEWS
jgi:hypothetical protein